GQFGGLGVMDTSDSSEDISFEPVSSGNRYDLIGARRDWQGEGGVTKFEPGKGGTTKKVPAFNRAPGILADHLLYLVHLQAGRSTLDGIFDLLSFGPNSRVQILD